MSNSVDPNNEPVKHEGVSVLEFCDLLAQSPTLENIAQAEQLLMSTVDESDEYSLVSALLEIGNEASQAVVLRWLPNNLQNKYSDPIIGHCILRMQSDSILPYVFKWVELNSEHKMLGMTLQCLLILAPSDDCFAYLWDWLRGTKNTEAIALILPMFMSVAREQKLSLATELNDYAVAWLVANEDQIFIAPTLGELVISIPGDRSIEMAHAWLSVHKDNQDARAVYYGLLSTKQAPLLVNDIMIWLGKYAFSRDAAILLKHAIEMYPTSEFISLAKQWLVTMDNPDDRCFLLKALLRTDHSPELLKFVKGWFLSSEHTRNVEDPELIASYNESILLLAALKEFHDADLLEIAKQWLVEHREHENAKELQALCAEIQSNL